MPSPAQLAQTVAEALRMGTWTEDAALKRVTKRLGGVRPRWLRPIVRDLFREFPFAPPVNEGELIVGILSHGRFRKSAERLARDSHRAGEPPREQHWGTPALNTAGEVAEWLSLPMRDLHWLADPRALEGRTEEPRLLNYRYRWVRKRTRSWRLLEIPKDRLRAVQRQILGEIVAKIPPHDAACGFRRGQSVQTFVAPHVGAEMILRLDLADFFPSISERRVRSIFRTAGYSDAIAILLAALCTNTASRVSFEEIPEGAPPQAKTSLRRLYGAPHVPQGAPTSPALANLAAWKLDRRLAGLARKAGGRYTRYADDLLFSGDATFARRARRFAIHVAAIVMEEGFSVAFRKTRLMRRSQRQHAAGLVINEHPNIRRADYDLLKATLCNCLRDGPASQNRESVDDFRAHLTGRVAYVEHVNPARGEKLRRLLNQIVW